MDEIADYIESLSSQLGSFLKEFSEGPSFQDQVLAFAHAVDWTEPWIVALVASHLLLLVTVLLTRKWETFQAVIFVFGVMAVWCAEYINALAARNWKSFSRQDYFDKSGLFMTVMFSGPIMVICIIVLVQLMFGVVQTMYRWKRAELKHRARLAAKQRKDQAPEAKTLKGE